MNLDEFWKLIEDKKNLSNDNTSIQVDLLIYELSKKSLDEIFDYEKIFYTYYMNSYKSSLWAVAYTLNGGCSDDAFDYFRAWLITQGRAFFEMFMKHPEKFAEEANIEMDLYDECEFMIGVSRDAYKKKTDKNDYYKVFAKIWKNIDSPPNDLDWEEDNINEVLPKFYKKFSKYWKRDIK